MATGTFSLYLADNTTPVAIPKPVFADWETFERGKYPDGRKRVSLYKRVIWKFPELSSADYQKFVQYRIDGRQTFETWKRPTGAVAGIFVVATGILDETVPGIRNQHGVYKNVTVTFTMVTES